MKKTMLILFVIAASFFSGFTLKTILRRENEPHTMKKVTGIGGIFFKCKDPKKVKEWYQPHVGLNFNQYGTVF